MKKFFSTAVASFALLAMVACGGSSSEGNNENSENSDGVYDVTLDSKTINGKLSQYFSVEDKTYKYKKDNLVDEVNVELTCIKPLPENMLVSIGMDVIDEGGTVVAAGSTQELYSDDLEMLRQATAGETITITFKNYENLKTEIPAKIRLKSTLKEKTGKEAKEDSELDNSSETSSKDMDKDLEDLGKAVDASVGMLKAAGEAAKALNELEKKH